MSGPYVSRLLEQCNDVESNPGPPSTSSSRKKNGGHGCNGSEAAPAVGMKAITHEPDARSEEAMKAVLAEQKKLIEEQRLELDALRRELEANVRVTSDFKAEMSEMRKNLENKGHGDGHQRSNGDSSAVVAKLDQLSAAYNDIQDRLYEIDKSWKNNVVIYGIQCSETMDEDPNSTEEKVRCSMLTMLLTNWK